MPRKKWHKEALARFPYRRGRNEPSWPEYSPLPITGEDGNPSDKNFFEYTNVNIVL